jgi:hypothetical protein
MHVELYGLLRDYYLQLTSMEPRAFLFAQKTGRPWTRKVIEKRNPAMGACGGRRRLPSAPLPPYVRH